MNREKVADKQVPKLVTGIAYDGIGQCPCCNHLLERYQYTAEVKYCYFCGQAVKWGRKEASLCAGSNTTDSELDT